MINKYDELLKTANWLEETDLPVAIVLRETLESVEGDDAIIFPPTFAKGDKAAHPYQIDELRKDSPLQILNRGNDFNSERLEKFFRDLMKKQDESESSPQNLDSEDFNICEIDTVGRQADRMEISFVKEDLSALVPQIEIVADDQRVNLLEVGHRISDASIRYSTLDEAALPAIKKLADENDALPLAKLAPTSLIFGFWDSQKTRTQFKFGRILSSTIKATNVAVAKRSSQFTPAFDAVALNLATLEEIPEAGGEVESAKASDGKDPLSKIGLRSVPAVDKHGGVRVFGKITRRTQINLVGLRALEAKGENDEATREITMKLRRYLFGLALIGGRAQTNYALRQGCHLVLKPDAKVECSQILPDGTRQDFTWNLRDAYEFARQAAEDFGVEEVPQALFEKEKAKQAKAEAKKAK
jgi:CRISPR-associated protein Csb1